VIVAAIASVEDVTVNQAETFFLLYRRISTIPPIVANHANTAVMKGIATNTAW